MSFPLKVLTALIGIPIVCLGGAFVYGMYLGATGQYEPREVKTEEPAPVVSGEQPALQEPPVAAEAPATDSVQPPSGTAGLPDPLDAASVTTWLNSTRFFYVEGEDVKTDETRLAALSVEQAFQLYDALRAGGKQHQTMRLFFFAAMGELGLAQRAEFAKRVGAVFRQSDQSRLNAYTGDFSNLLFLQTNDSESVYARAVRNYAMVLESKEIVAALIHIGAVQEDLARDQWTIRIEHKMQDFDAQTLMSIHERIEPAFFGNRKYLRDQLEDFAKSKR